MTIALDSRTLKLVFGIGTFEMALCGLIVLLVYGPDKLPTVARKAGRFIRDFKQISDAVTIAVRREMNSLERLADEEDAKKKLDAQTPETVTQDAQSEAVKEETTNHVTESIPRD